MKNIEVLVRRPLQHGKRSTYNYHGCRCEECRAANAAHARARWAKGTIPRQRPTSRQVPQSSVEQLMACGLSNSQIMARLGVSYETVSRVRRWLEAVAS